MKLEYSNYFDRSEYGLPYDSGLEETYGYLRWLDLFLDSYLLSGNENAQETAADIRERLIRGEEYLKSRCKASMGMPMELRGGISLSNLAAEFGLFGFSFFCLLLAAAPELDTRYVQIYQTLQEKYGGAGCATFELALRLYAMYAGEKEFDDVPQQMQAVKNSFLFLISKAERTGSGLLDGFVLSAQAVLLIRGDATMPRTLWPLCMESDADYLPEMIDDRGYLAKLQEVLSFQNEGLIQIVGKPLCGKKLLIASALEQTPALFVELPRLNGLDAKHRAGVLNEILVRCRLLHAQLVLLHADLPEDAYVEVTTLIDLCLQIVDRVILTSEGNTGTIRLAESYDYYLLEMETPTLKDRIRLWKYFGGKYGLAESVDPEAYADQYNFTAGQIEKVCMLADKQRLAEKKEKITDELLRRAIRMLLPRDIEKLATKIEPKFTFADVRMDERQKDTLKLACSRMKYRNRVNDEWGFGQKVTYGRGVSVLLYGPPGTGKTMSAQAIANELGMELYRVDLSQLVDKYIGETEKNLNRVFDCAKDGNFILFFDEADALFAKRTEISSSNDKYANNEVAFLLQKIEEFDGFIILATNVYSNFDSAFIRRITYCILLEKPQPQTRVEMLRGMLPPQTPVDPNLQLENMANNFELTGSEMKSVLYGAAFIAISHNESLSDRHIISSLSYVLSKTNRLMTEFEVTRKYYAKP